jgi:hypothetical protein
MTMERAKGNVLYAFDICSLKLIILAMAYFGST